MSSSLQILVAEPSGYSPEALSILRSTGDVVAKEVTRAELISILRDFDVLVVRLGHRIDAELLDAAPRLRAVVTPTTGLDHVDLDAAEERGVAVLSLKGDAEFLRGVTSTAEHAWGLLLALLRRTVEAHAHASSGGWDRDRFRGSTVAGKRVGILGLGRVGSQVAGYAKAFRAEVGACDPRADPWPADVRRFDAVVALAEWADVLTVHVPLDSSTRGLVGHEVLEALGPDGWLVNTSRGAIVDERALVAALRSGRIRGAALDVLEGETGPAPPTRAEILALANEGRVVLTPHLGGATAEAMAMTEVRVATKLKEWWNAR